ncbi:DUF4402 domain-containing protein [Novosphingobium sp.]|uniref:DUF4402 domain-containing protein n=1 Tax=Novosphingobium sp. TaxID=1874826 RepID=UPI001EC03921|nr:DUF4402 domain-containing protein [Novosphingobium sp.]MBK6800048.1 DUF4402 domain-containing protein [Novosphingobium sp.]MBK9010937.1 DUF4402 domain-containing protein [Novosphingobium sp.]
MLVGPFLATAARAETATATASASAVVVEPASLINNRSLAFGRFAASTTAGTVTVNPDTGQCTTTGGVVQAGGCHSAEFTGMGVRRMTLRIALPTTIALTGPGGATMTVTTVTMDTTPDLNYLGGNGHGLGNGRRRYEIVPNSGIFNFRVAGTLGVGANQAPGVYTGSFAVTVQYQ